MSLPTLTPLELSKPERGEATLDHDETFSAVNDALTTMRDVANKGIDALNQAGAGLARLPEGDLYGLLVAPLTGDYAAIQQNTRACFDVRDALDTWGDNILRISLAIAPAWGGQAATAYLLRVNALGLGARAVGEVVRAGAIVFDEIAVFSERIGIQVEKLLVELGRTLVRLGRRLLAKVGGPSAWAMFAAELVMKGLDAVTEIIDDVKKVIELIGVIRDLHDTVVDWVAKTRTRLGVLHDLSGLVTR